MEHRELLLEGAKQFYGEPAECVKALDDWYVREMNNTLPVYQLRPIAESHQIVSFLNLPLRLLSPLLVFVLAYC